MSDSRVSKGDRVRRRATGEFGVVDDVEGDFAQIVFAQTGPATLHVDDVEPAAADPTLALRKGDLSPHPEYALRLQARYLQHAYKYDIHSGLSNARVEPQLHQVFVAHRVNRKLRPRMILCDEVGLGKTIEAGLVLKEQIARGRVERVLIVCPASLQYQWLYELRSKFNEDFAIVDGPTARMLSRDGTNPWARVDRAITSIQFARREDIAAQIIETPWDLVIFDEAHHVRRRYEGADRYRSTQAYRLADELKERVDGMLLLTATPMQLHPFELYSLIELVEPGLYPSFAEYDARRRTLPTLNALMRDLQSWGALDDQAKHRCVNEHASLLLETGGTANVDDLDSPSRREQVMDCLVERHPLSQTLVRNRKSVVGGFTRRRAYRIPVPLKPEEAEIHAQVTDYIVEGYNRAVREQQRAVGFLMVLYQKMLASSSNAIRESFKKRAAALREQLQQAKAFAAGDLSEEELLALIGEEELSEAIDALEEIALNREAAEWEIQLLDQLITKLGKLRDSKAVTLLTRLIDPTFEQNPAEKVLIFTRFIETQRFLHQMLDSAGYRVVSFNGAMDLEEKERAVRQFRNSAQIMVTTEAGGEGRNFQFAHIMINYDLPWNPMVVEQRIGRLDRIGQTREVIIYNLACEGTIEERVLDVLENRINLFEESVGALDPILGEVERDIERLAMEHADSLDREIETYGRDLERRVKEARLKEEVLADFILDRASLRRDEAQELLGEKPLATWVELHDFVSDSLDYFGGRLSPHAEGGVSLSLSPKLSQRLGIKTAVTRGEFNPAVALTMEDLPFLAFGHEAIDSLVSYVAEQAASAGARRTSYAPKGWSVEIIYELEALGVRPHGSLIRHLVGPRLQVVESVLHEIPEVGEAVDPPPDLPWVEEAVEASRKAIAQAQESARQAATVENEEIRREALARAQQVYEYQKERLRRVIAEGEEWIARAERSGSEGDRRVLPARRGRLNRDKERLAALDEIYATQIEEINTKQADVSLRVVAAGLVVGG